MSKKPSITDAISTGDLFVVWKSSDGDYRLASAPTVLAYVLANLPDAVVGQGEYTTQYAAPSATGFTVPITDDGTNVHLILTPTTGFAAGTITLPANPGALDKQEVLVNCTQQITALTINGNGAIAVTGEPLAMGADDFFRLKFDLPTQTWYRVG